MTFSLFYIFFNQNFHILILIASSLNVVQSHCIENVRGIYIESTYQKVQIYIESTFQFFRPGSMKQVTTIENGMTSEIFRLLFLNLWNYFLFPKSSYQRILPNVKVFCCEYLVIHQSWSYLPILPLHFQTKIIRWSRPPSYYSPITVMFLFPLLELLFFEQLRCI